MRAISPLQPPCPGATDQSHAPRKLSRINFCNKGVYTKLAADAAEVRALVYLGIGRPVRRRHHLTNLVDYCKGFCSKLI